MAATRTEEGELVEIKEEVPEEEVVVKSVGDGNPKEVELGDEALPHQDAMAKVNNTITELIKTDPLLKDLPSGVTVEEVNSALAVEYGQAMIVNVCRADGETLKVVVIQDATVRDLKHAIQRHMTLRLSRRGQTSHVSWRYIWRTYWLYFNGQKLSNTKKTLKSYGIRNRDEVTFLKRLRKQH